MFSITFLSFCLQNKVQLTNTNKNLVENSREKPAKIAQLRRRCSVSVRSQSVDVEVAERRFWRVSSSGFVAESTGRSSAPPAGMEDGPRCLLPLTVLRQFCLQSDQRSNLVEIFMLWKTKLEMRAESLQKFTRRKKHSGTKTRFNMLLQNNFM